MSIMINRESRLIVVTTSEDGVSTRGELLSDEHQGAARETVRRVERRITNVDQHERAKALRTRAHALVRKYSTFVPALSANLSDESRVRLFRDEWRELVGEIGTHNVQLGQEHPLEVTMTILPFGLALDASAQRLLCDQVTKELTAIKVAMISGDVDRAMVAIRGQKNLGALMPAVVGAVVDKAIDSAREARNTMAAAMRGSKERTPLTLDQALALEEVKDALLGLDAAIGWCSQPVAEDPASPSPVVSAA